MSKHYVQIDCPNCAEKLHVVYVTDSCKTPDLKKSTNNSKENTEDVEDVIESLEQAINHESISDKIDRIEKSIMNKFKSQEETLDKNDLEVKKILGD